MRAIPIPLGTYGRNLWISSDGTIFLLATDSVVRFAPTGEELGRLGAGEIVSTPFLSAPKGLVLDGAGNVYVSNSQESEMLQYSPGGDLLRRIPTGDRYTLLALDDRGNLYTADWGGGSVYAYDRLGRLRRTVVVDFGGSKMVVHDRKLYFSDPNRWRIVVYDLVWR